MAAATNSRDQRGKREHVAEFNAEEVNALNPRLIEDFRANNGAVTIEPFTGIP